MPACFPVHPCRVAEAKNVGSEVKVILVGNKSDLTESRAITREQGVELAQSEGIEYFETSVKDGTNVTEAVDKLLDLIYSTSEPEPEPEPKPEPEPEDVTPKKPVEEPKEKDPILEKKPDPVNEPNVETVPDKPKKPIDTKANSCWSTGSLLFIGCACIAVICAWYFSKDK